MVDKERSRFSVAIEQLITELVIVGISAIITLVIWIFVKDIWTSVLSKYIWMSIIAVVYLNVFMGILAPFGGLPGKLIFTTTLIGLIGCILASGVAVYFEWNADVMVPLLNVLVSSFFCLFGIYKAMLQARQNFQNYWMSFLLSYSAHFVLLFLYKVTSTPPIYNLYVNGASFLIFFIIFMVKIGHRKGTKNPYHHRADNRVISTEMTEEEYEDYRKEKKQKRQERMEAFVEWADEHNEKAKERRERRRERWEEYCESAWAKEDAKQAVRSGGKAICKYIENQFYGGVYVNCSWVTVGGTVCVTARYRLEHGPLSWSESQIDSTIKSAFNKAAANCPAPCELDIETTY